MALFHHRRLSGGYPSHHFCGLKDWETRERQQQAISAELAPQTSAGAPGLLAFATNPPSLGQGVISKAVEVVIQTSGSYEELQGIVG